MPHALWLEPLIVCENLVKIYRLNQEAGGSVEVQALQGMDITVAEGEMLGIVGERERQIDSAQCPRRIRPPHRRTRLVGRQDLGQMSAGALDEYRRKTVGFVWQQGARNLIPYLTALENIELPLTLSGQVGKSTRRARWSSSNWLAYMNAEIIAWMNSPAASNSVLLAIALANHPVVVSG